MKITEYKKKDGSVVYRSSVYLGIDTVTGKKVKTTISDITKNRLKSKAIQAKVEFEKTTQQLQKSLTLPPIRN